jgi:hypothetical protein
VQMVVGGGSMGGSAEYTGRDCKFVVESRILARIKFEETSLE